MLMPLNHKGVAATYRQYPWRKFISDIPHTGTWWELFENYRVSVDSVLLEAAGVVAGLTISIQSLIFSVCRKWQATDYTYV